MRKSPVSQAVRSAFLVALGAALVVGPVALDLGPAALVTAVVAGVIAVALGFAGTAPDGRGTLPVSAQAAYDRGLGLGLLLAGATFGLGGHTAALIFFAVAGLAVLTVAVTTRYGF